MLLWARQLVHDAFITRVNTRNYNPLMYQEGRQTYHVAFNIIFNSVLGMKSCRTMKFQANLPHCSQDYLDNVLGKWSYKILESKLATVRFYQWLRWYRTCNIRWYRTCAGFHGLSWTPTHLLKLTHRDTRDFSSDSICWTEFVDKISHFSFNWVHRVSRGYGHVFPIPHSGIPSRQSPGAFHNDAWWEQIMGDAQGKWSFLVRK